MVKLGVCDDSESIAHICFARRTFFGLKTDPTKLMSDESLLNHSFVDPF